MRQRPRRGSTAAHQPQAARAEAPLQARLHLTRPRRGTARLRPRHPPGTRPAPLQVASIRGGPYHPPAGPAPSIGLLSTAASSCKDAPVCVPHEALTSGMVLPCTCSGRLSRSHKARSIWGTPGWTPPPSTFGSPTWTGGGSPTASTGNGAVNRRRQRHSYRSLSGRMVITSQLLEPTGLGQVSRHVALRQYGAKLN